ncbi:MAG: hypothetical protein COS28_01020 [Nitrospirae bacterium CG02_land_8_20_14_3_00_44_33]|nr:thioredoxin family protein [Nitrospirota bacterium]PIV44198.1 MAG: hypothetical protein COS28_01020 [Nitrospirae bacterium CG02_land_8_20_14_3_00_44_33]PIW88831.1 MAG: hypothetical protein COZ93_08295 [Nitrospirae bacterium CG_4_8_14_3_um_filter_44_28]PJA81304.1 MAG: hypothetical protein CO147_10615 [Nitrospirae bacterium CG_4_9_14_3_um_filter_44_28]
MKKKLFLEAIFLTIIGISLVAFNVYRQNRAASKMEIFYFYSPECPNCKEVKPFIESLRDELKKKKTKFVELNVKEHEGWNPIYKFLAQKISQKINTDFIPLPTATVRHRERFYTFIGKDEIINHLNDFLLSHAGIKKITARLNKQSLNVAECISCHTARNLPPPSTLNCTFCCHRGVK